MYIYLKKKHFEKKCVLPFELKKTNNIYPVI